MAGKKNFDLNPISEHNSVNPLAEIHSAEPMAVIPEKKQDIKSEVESPSLPGEDESRINQNFYIKRKFVQLIETGRLEEKFRSKADFLDHILDSYFSGKPYNKTKGKKK